VEDRSCDLVALTPKRSRQPGAYEASGAGDQDSHAPDAL